MASWLLDHLLLDHATALWVMVLIAVAVAPAVCCIWCTFYCTSYSKTELYHPEGACKVLFDRRTDYGQMKGYERLPECLAGVFWMDGSPTEELLLTFEGQEWNPERRTLIFRRGAAFAGSFNSDHMGWLHWAYVRAGTFCGAQIQITFHEQSYEHASIKWYMFGCMRVPLGVNWHMKRLDESGDQPGDNWEVSAEPTCCPLQKCFYGSFTLRKVVDGRRKKVRPNYDDMMSSFQGPSPGCNPESRDKRLCCTPPLCCYQKTEIQIVQGYSDAMDAHGIYMLITGGSLPMDEAALMHSQEEHEQQHGSPNRHGSPARHGSPEGRERTRSDSRNGSPHGSDVHHDRHHDRRHDRQHDRHHDHPHDRHDHHDHHRRDDHHHRDHAHGDVSGVRRELLRDETGDEAKPPQKWRQCCFIFTSILLLATFIYALVCYLIAERPFDCWADFDDWENAWIFEKKMWCCENEQMGCVTPSIAPAPTITITTTTTFTERYNCEAGFLQQRKWSAGKQAWCCLTYQRGCPRTTSTVPFNCEAGILDWSNSWSMDKKAWCCEHESVGCPGDAAAGAASVVGAAVADG